MTRFLKDTILFLLCTYISASALCAQENPVSGRTSCVPVRTTSEEKLAFGPGETMEFILHYKWGSINTDVGHATVRLDSLTFNGEKAFCCSASGRTTKFFDIFFKVREEFKSWFTRDGLRPLKFTRDTYEGGYEARNTYLYDWNPSDPHIDADIYTSKMGDVSMTLPLTPCTFDLPALFFFARNMDVDNVEPGRRYPMTFAIDDEVFNVYFILYGRETIKVKGIGTVKTIRFAAKLLEGEVFKGEEDMMIWVTDDENRLPVYFEAPLRVGVAAGRMSGYGGLKHPFTSLVNTKKR
ncbi:MAG: DUF3108 domain-containing protein [Bacteroidales bacterium]|nr:DUF3108 domain-containing protein [Bacteroidales bacterium]